MVVQGYMGMTPLPLLLLPLLQLSPCLLPSLPSLLFLPQLLLPPFMPSSLQLSSALSPALSSTLSSALLLALSFALSLALLLALRCG